MSLTGFRPSTLTAGCGPTTGAQRRARGPRRPVGRPTSEQQQLQNSQKCNESCSLVLESISPIDWLGQVSRFISNHLLICIRHSNHLHWQREHVQRSFDTGNSDRSRTWRHLTNFFHVHFSLTIITSLRVVIQCFWNWKSNWISGFCCKVLKICIISVVELQATSATQHYVTR